MSTKTPIFAVAIDDLVTSMRCKKSVMACFIEVYLL